MFTNKSSVILIVVSFVTLLSIYLFSETKLIVSVLLVGSLLSIHFYLKKRENISFDFLDILLLFVIIAEVFSFIFSVNPLNSYTILCFNLLVILYFFVVKSALKNEKYSLFLLRSGIYIILGLCLFSIYSFWILKNVLHSVEWFSLYDFRHLHRPFGLISNVWYSFLLLFLLVVLFYYYTYKEKKILCYITLITIVLNLIFSFSRSVFLILILITVVSFIQFIFCKNSFRILICLILPTLICYSFFKEDFHKTLSFNSSVSQQRSISARVESTSNAINLLKHNYLGYGQGSYSLVNSQRFEDVDIPFTSFAPNIIAQLLIEKGILSTIIWIGFFGFLVYLLLKQTYSNKDKSLFFIVLISFFVFSVRELSFPVFLENLLFQILFYTYIALLINTPKPHFDFQYNIAGKKIFIFFTSLTTIILSSNCFFKNQISIEKNIQAGITNWNEYKKSNSENDSLLKQSDTYFQKAISLNPFDIRIKFFHALTTYEKGDKQQALQKIASLIEKYPKNSLYNFTMFSLLEKENNKNSINFLIKAIELSPKILETDFFKQFLKEKPSVYEELKDFFYQKYIKNTSENPFELGKQGKIFLYFGFNDEAHKKILRASELYPALSYVWLNLYTITHQELYLKRFVLLEYGSYFLTNIEKYQQDFFAQKTNIDFLQNAYIPRYQSWYMNNTNYFIID